MNKFEPEAVFSKGQKYWRNPELKVTLTREDEEVRKLFSSLISVMDVANLLEIPLGQLQYILYGLNPKYNSFEIPKKNGGKRKIHQPCSSLKILQNKIKPLIENLYQIKKPVHGFVSIGVESKQSKLTIQKGIKSNAEQHSKKKYVLNIDLTDFFHSINFGRVRGIFIATPFKMGEKAATILAQICTFSNGLPQGASTSPVLSNLAARTLDTALVKLAQDNHLIYTRYADDLTFSSNEKIPEKIVKKQINNNGVISYIVGEKLNSIIKESGFKINPTKTRLQGTGDRQEVTGLVVNKGVNVNRRFIRETRAMIYNWSRDPKKAEIDYLKKKHGLVGQGEIKGHLIKKVIYGRLSFIEMIRGKEFSPYLKLCKSMLDKDTSPPKSILELKEIFGKYDVFICHAHEDKNKIAIPIYDGLVKKGLKVFIDSKKITWGDSVVDIINTALRKSTYVLAIISEKSIKKEWPMKELNAVLSAEILSKKTRLLPLLVGDDSKLITLLPLLGDKLYKKYDNNLDEIIEDLSLKINNTALERG